MRHILFLAFVGVVCAGSDLQVQRDPSPVSRQNAVSRAIEQTKSRQSQAKPARIPQRTAGNKANNSPGRSESLDVNRLNLLIHSLDKTWVMPRATAKEPVGSNFQYKKTCSSIFKARHGACQQLGFGVMCFNYCHERGEKLSFRCQDASDAAYCRQSGTFETFLAKYRKDAYKAKAYVHQMISRCYATTICNTQTGILNSTMIEEAPLVPERTTRMNRLKLLTRRPKKNKTTTTLPPTPPPEVDDIDADTDAESDVETKTTKRKSSGKSRRPKTTTVEAAVTTSKPNIWDKFTVGQKARPTPKYIPFWQRLMSTTDGTPTSNEDTEEIEESVEVTTSQEKPKEAAAEESVEKVVEEVPEETTTKETSTLPPTTKKQKIIKLTVATTTTRAPETTQSITEQTTSVTEAERHTFRPLPMSTPPPIGPELHPKPEGTGPGTVFWNRFQPNRWYQSVHYITNTGKK